MVRQLSERLARRGYEIVVLTRGALPRKKTGVDIVSIRGFLDYRSKLDSLSRTAEVMMVYGQKVWCSDWLPLARVHCPVVYFPVGFDSWGKSLFHRLYYRAWQKRICEMADILGALTKREEDFLKSWIGHDNLIRIPNGVDFEYWQKAPEDTTTQIAGPFLFHAGGYYNNKRVDTLIEVTAALHREGYEVDLVTCGPDFKHNRDRMRDLAKERGIERSYYALGEVAASTLRSLYESCEVYVSASTFEGFGLTFLEALACGKPLVCRPVGVAPELAERSKNILVADSVDSLASGIEHFLDEGCDPAESRTVARRYDWERVVDELEAAYLGLL